jgi:hypothetical protein
LICDFISLINPFDLDQGESILDEISGMLHHFRAVAEKTRRALPCPLYPDTGGLLPCGGTENGNVLGWLTVGEPVLSTWTDDYYSNGCDARNSA